MKCEDNHGFYESLGLSKEEFDGAGIARSTLEEIAEDHSNRFEDLSAVAQMSARFLLGIEQVHSVRWRVKDPRSLQAKIVRKLQQGSSKYREINAGNYHIIVSDLIGLRALHLFKDEMPHLHAGIVDCWDPVEKILYKRAGDGDVSDSLFHSDGFKIVEHEAGYRSVHYVLRSKPTNREIFQELQVRTVFEEGWSEIDHKIRYPAHSDDGTLAFFLQAFNRLAGSADEMGTFVKQLSLRLADLKKRAADAEAERDSLDATLKDAQRSLEEMKAEAGASREIRQRFSNLTEALKALENLARSTKSGSLSGLAVPQLIPYAGPSDPGHGENRSNSQPELSVRIHAPSVRISPKADD